MPKAATAIILLLAASLPLVPCETAFAGKAVWAKAHRTAAANRVHLEQSGTCLNMYHGAIASTGQCWDLAIEGEGYIVLSDGWQNLYSRGRSFGVNANCMLVDPYTGYRLQRIGSTGETDRLQIPGDSDIHVPYDVNLPGRATTEVVLSGNLSSDEVLTAPQGQQLTSNVHYTCNNDIAAATRAEIEQLDSNIDLIGVSIERDVIIIPLPRRDEGLTIAHSQVLTSNIRYTYNGIVATWNTEIDQLDQFSGGSGPGGQLDVGESGLITISGYHPDGTAFSSGLNFYVFSDTTLWGLINNLNQNVLSGAAATLVNGKIRITDDTGGYSKSDISMSYSGDGELETPAYFEMIVIGGEYSRSIEMVVYDSLGGKHILNYAFVRTDTSNTWDMVLRFIMGDISEITIDNRRIEGISFNNSDGSFAGISGNDTAEFVITFACDTSNPQTISIFLGTPGKYDGLFQFAGPSTAEVRWQDGYGVGRLRSVAVNFEGTLVGAFSSGVTRDIATIQMAMFEDVCGLECIGDGHFISTDDSGQAIVTQAMADGAGIIHGGALEQPTHPLTLIEDAIDEKTVALEGIDAALAREWAVIEALNQLLADRGVVGQERRDVLLAKLRIYHSIYRQTRSKAELRKSIRELENSLTLLGW